MCGFFLLSISSPPLVLSCNKQHEGGYNWEVQSSARWNHLYLNTGSRSLSRSLWYIVSLPLFLLLYFPLLHSVCSINMMQQGFATILSLNFSKILHSFSFTNCFFSESSTVYSLQYNSSPPTGKTPASVLKGTCQALPLKGVYTVFLFPSFSFLSSCLNAQRFAKRFIFFQSYNNIFS